MASRLARRSDAKTSEHTRRLGTAKWTIWQYRMGRIAAWSRYQHTPTWGYADYLLVYNLMRNNAQPYKALGYISVAQTLRRLGRIGA